MNGFKIGDPVTFGRGAVDFKIVATVGHEAWLKSNDGYSRVVEMAELRPIQKSFAEVRISNNGIGILFVADEAITQSGWAIPETKMNHDWTGDRLRELAARINAAHGGHKTDSIRGVQQLSPIPKPFAEVRGDALFIGDRHALTQHTMVTGGCFLSGLADRINAAHESAIKEAVAKCSR